MLAPTTIYVLTWFYLCIDTILPLYWPHFTSVLTLFYLCIEPIVPLYWHDLSSVFTPFYLTYKNMKKLSFWGFIPFDCLISSKIICFNTVKIGRSFVKNNNNPKTPSKTVILDNLKTWRLAHSKNKGRHVFILSKKNHFSGCFCFFWRRHNLVTRTVSQLWWFFLPLIKQIIHFFQNHENCNAFLVCEYLKKKVLNHSLSIIFQLSKKNTHKFEDFF